MAVRTVFASESGNQPASQLDAMFLDVWNGATMSCTATGTNAYVLTVRANVSAPLAYVPGQRFGFYAPATSTGNVTIAVGALAALNLYQPGATQAGSGVIVIANYYEVVYDAALNAGAGGFWLANATAASVSVPTQGSFKNLVITNTTAATAASQLILTADQLVVWNVTGGSFTAQAVNVTIDATVAGANGLDTGVFAANTAYYVWVIYNPGTATIAGLLSLSITAPTTPAGYTYKARFGGCMTTTGPKFINWMQRGRRAQYLLGTYNGNGLSALPLMDSGARGSIPGPTWFPITLSNYFPATASEIYVTLACARNDAADSTVMVAPNNNYSNWVSISQPPIIMDQVLTSKQTMTFNMMVETGTIYWASSAAGGAISAFGWIDNL